MLSRWKEATVCPCAIDAIWNQLKRKERAFALSQVPSKVGMYIILVHLMNPLQPSQQTVHILPLTQEMMFPLTPPPPPPMGHAIGPTESSNDLEIIPRPLHRSTRPTHKPFRYIRKVDESSMVKLIYDLVANKLHTLTQ